MQKALVVARFNEDCVWLNSLGKEYDIVIQNKGEENTPPSLKSRKIPNIGLDQYCYLEYIISHYDCLPEYIVFTQANITDHLDTIEPCTCLVAPKEYYTDGWVDPDVKGMTSNEVIALLFKQVVTSGHTLNARMYKKSDGGYCAHPNLKITRDYVEDDSGLSFGEWFGKNIGFVMPPPERFIWFKNGIFGATKASILSRPKSFYQRICNQITNDRGEVLHYIERSWYYMLNLHQPRPFSYHHTLMSFRHVFENLDRIVRESGQPFVEGSIFFFGNQDMRYNDIFLHKQVNLFNLAKNALNIVEIGFNAGHSTALMLMANPQSRILLFDLNEHAYTKTCYEYLKAVFGVDRFIGFEEGDSRKTLPRFIASNNVVRYDLIHIDGGHTEIVAMSDIFNGANLACANNTLVIDDYDIPAVKSVAENFKKLGLLKELPHDDHASYKGSYYHLIGTYLGR